MLRPTVSRQVCLGVKPHLGPKTRFLLLSDSYGLVDVGSPLSREDRSVVYNCCWPSPAQSFSGPSPVGLMTIFTISDSRLPQPGGPGSRIYIPLEQGGPVTPPDTGFPFRRLLRLAGVRWRYPNPPPRRVLNTGAKSSQNHFATDGQPISKSWCRASDDQIFITL
jgi:hypothetical protein